VFICRLIVSAGVIKVSGLLGEIETTKYKLEKGELVHD
jgi:hypothetical protein